MLSSYFSPSFYDLRHFSFHLTCISVSLILSLPRQHGTHYTIPPFLFSSLLLIFIPVTLPSAFPPYHWQTVHLPAHPNASLAFSLASLHLTNFHSFCSSYLPSFPNVSPFSPSCPLFYLSTCIPSFSILSLPSIPSRPSLLPGQ